MQDIGNVIVTVENGSYIMRLDRNTNKQLIHDIGTSTLPLPFTAMADPSIVHDHVQQRIHGTIRMVV